MDSHSKIKWDWKKKTVLGVGIVLLVLQAVRMTVDGKGDFNLHWESGRRLVTGDDLYYFGLNCPYPPFWALVHAPLSFLPIPVAQLLFYPLFLVAFLLLGRTLRRMTKGGVSQPSPRFSLRGRGRILEPAHHEPPHAGSVEDSVPSHLGRIDANARFWIFVGAVLLTSRFLVRDMMECGVNLLMVALAWFAIELWSRHKEKRAGLWLGLAISLKCTPALFLLFFAWKRQWRMVRWTMVFVVGFTLSPILVMGPQKYVSAMTYWTTMSWRGFGKSDPSLGTLGQEPIQNDALRPALARFFMHLPKDHKARLDHPFYFDFLNLDPAVAGWMIRILILVLVITIVRRIPRSVEERRGWNMLWECTMVSDVATLVADYLGTTLRRGVAGILYDTVDSTYETFEIAMGDELSCVLFAGNFGIEPHGDWKDRFAFVRFLPHFHMVFASARFHDSALSGPSAAIAKRPGSGNLIQFIDPTPGFCVSARTNSTGNTNR